MEIKNILVQCKKGHCDFKIIDKNTLTVMDKLKICMTCKNITVKEHNRFVVIGRRWFDKINGNTYHNVCIYDNEGNLIYESGMTYGYDEQYKQTAKDFLIKSGLLDKKDEYNHELLRGLIQFSVTDVTRKKDL